MSLQAIADSRLGQVLRGKYRLERVLGVGGMASVYRAEHRNRRQFAVKMLHPEFTHHEDIRTRFLREGYAANSVSHPGAVAVLDDDVAEDGTAFLVMELLDGASVEQLWEQRDMALPVAAVLALAEQLLDVLRAAHAHGIVHRDLKPANLFITRDGTVKVLDFGIARLTETQAHRSTQTGQTLGTPAFMAPEQAMGKNEEIDAQTDLWSVGATLFLLLSGRYVYETETTQQLLIALALTPARSVASVVPSLEPAVARLVDGALISDKAGRFADVAAMQSALRAARSALGTASADSPQRELARLFTQGGPRSEPAVFATPSAERARSSWPRLLSAGALVALLGAAGAFMLLRDPPDAHTDDELVRQDEAQERARTGTTVPALPLAPRTSEETAPASGVHGVKRGPRVARGSEHGIDPRAAQRPSVRVDVHPALPPSGASSATCTRFLERQSLGEDLSSEELATFERECRR